MNLRSVCHAAARVAVLSVAVLVIPACAAPRGRLFVRIGPPAPIIETRAVAPGPGYVWIPGYYTWDGRAYAWAPGRWDRPPRPRAHWVAGHWQRDRRQGWYFVEGRWR